MQNEKKNYNIERVIGLDCFQLPQWKETVDGARYRYAQVIKTLADKYPSENLLLVTHGKLHSCVIFWDPNFKLRYYLGV